MKSPVTFFSSFLFGATAYYLNQNYSEEYRHAIIGCLIVMITSLSYHYTGHKIIRLVDMIAVQVCLWYSQDQVVNWHPYYISALLLLAVMGVVYWKNQKSDLVHSFLHLGGSIGILLSIEGHALSRLN